MIARFLSVSTAFGAVTVLCAAPYWLFLNTPESNTLTLTTSALLFVAVAIFTAIAVHAALLLARVWPSPPAPAGGMRGVLWFVLALGPLAAGWWAVGMADGWVERHSGEINAWFIARFGWADITSLFDLHLWVSRWLRWAVFPVLSLSFLATLLT